MIARDNERTIAAALEIIRKHVDDIVVVDTGSTDRTPQIAESLGARVFHFLWRDDFSAARNESIRHALGQWIFWMDTDDVIDEQNARKVRELALSLSNPSPPAPLPPSGARGESPVLGFLMKVRCPGTGENGDGGYIEVDQVKLFRNLPGIRFEGRIHEQVLMAIRRAGGTVAWTDIFVVHANADNSTEGRAKKLERDLRILQLDHQERPDHPFVLFNLGMTLAEAGQHAREKKGTGPIDHNGPSGAAHQLDQSPFSQLVATGGPPVGFAVAEKKGSGPIAEENADGNLLCEAPCGPFRQKTPVPIFYYKEGHQTIGRGADCDIHLHDPKVSRRHAELVKENGRLLIHDLDSRNGTFVDGKPVQSATIRVGSSLRIGRVTLDVVEHLPDLFRSKGDAEETERGAVHEPGDAVLRAAELPPARQRVLRLLLPGYREKHIGPRLGMSHQIVHRHVKKIYKKFGVHSRAELCAVFLK